MTQRKSPWGKPSGGTSGGGGNYGGGFGGGKRPEGPDLDALFRKSHDKFKQTFGPNLGEGRMLGLIIGAIAVLWLASGVYRVNSDELGVVMRFGEFNRLSNPGLNYHAPYPFETVIIPSVTSVNKVEIGKNSGVSNPGIRQSRMMAMSDAAAPLSENLMLTGDRNIVDIDFEVQWKIDTSRPQDFLFNTRDPEESVRSVAKSAMREVIGRNDLSDILTIAQSKIAEDTRELMQSMFDNYGSGIEVIAVNLSRPDVPADVIGEFQDVKRAEQNKETKETEAEGYRNNILPQARGEAIQMVQEAEAYKARVVAEAKGDASRFNAVYGQYVNAKEVTRERMYLETMEQVLKGMPKVIVDGGKGNFLPYMPLPAPTNPAAGKAAQ